MSKSVLVFNAGSSSLKFSLFDGKRLHLILTGEVEDLFTSPMLWTKVGEEDKKAFSVNLRPGLEEVMPAVLDLIATHTENNPISAIGHRVVHGGKIYGEPVIITPKVIQNLATFIPMAPMHQTHSLKIIEMTRQAYKNIPQVACFDTSFHHTQPLLAELMPLPQKFIDEGIIRYGFHGLSYQYISTQLPIVAKERAHKRVIVAHLGSGASICAMKDLKSVATSMGFTALDGLMMGKRPGSIDPGVILYLIGEKGLKLKEVTDILYNQSGLLGVSGLSSDIRELLKSSNPNAQLAIDLFSYIAAKQISSLLPTISGLDVLVFTAGIGENSSEIRKQICAHLQWLGVEVDEKLNDLSSIKISASKSSVDVYVIPTNEELMIATHASDLCD
jgi:acetate kinase